MTDKMPVDTISIKREVLQGVMQALKLITDKELMHSHAAIRGIAEHNLASLDAVLVEGK